MARLQSFRIDQDTAGQRLDRAAGIFLPLLSRSYIQKLCESGKIMINGAMAKAGYRLKASDVLSIDYDESELDAIPAIDLPILYEDDDCIVINKPAGVLTHSKGAFSPEATVSTFMRQHVNGISGNRAGIVHRLDRATSGVIICAKHPAALSWLQKQFSQRKVIKTYMAIVSGHVEPQHAVIDMPIERNPKHPQTFRVGSQGKPSVTEYRVVKEAGTVSMLELKPKTGRTHQLRVHLASVGHPIVGDVLYGGQAGERLFLHALSLEITLPNRERKIFTAVLPDEFSRTMET